MYSYTEESRLNQVYGCGRLARLREYEWTKGYITKDTVDWELQ
jgi:ribosomal protein L37E